MNNKKKIFFQGISQSIKNALGLKPKSAPQSKAKMPMLFRACDCFHSPCRHNPPAGERAVKRKNHAGYWFVKKDMGWFERLWRTCVQDYILD